MHQLVGIGADQHRARLGRRLQPGRDIGGITQRGVLGSDRIADKGQHRGAGIDPDPQVEIDAVLLLDAAGIAHCRILHLEPGAHRPLGVVLMRRWRTEERQHGIAHQSRHRAAIVRHGGVHEGKGAVHDAGPILGVHLLGYGSGARHIGKQHRRETAFAFDRSGDLERITAIGAKLSRVRVVETALEARLHRHLSMDLPFGH